MHSIGVKELKQNASRVLVDLEREGAMTVTVSGRPVAVLTALTQPTTWARPAQIAEVFGGGEVADGAAWVDELREQRRRETGPIDPFEAAGL